MKRCKKGVIAILLTFFMCIGAFPITTEAAEVKGASVDVRIALSGTLPSPAEVFEVFLTAKNGGTPMPEGSVDNVYSMGITGASTKAFPAITYVKPGVYEYQIHQQKGKNSDCTYDESVYTLTVYVTNSEANDGTFNISYVLYKDDAPDKVEEVVFKNVYKTIIPPTEPEPEPEEPEEVPEEPAVPWTELVPAETIPEPEIPVTPNTGDSANVMLWSCVLAASALMLGVICFVRKKETEENKESE